MARSHSSLDPERYKGKPLLRILELYVLWAIKAIEPEQESELRKLTPALRSAFKQHGTWREVVEAQMGFPPELPSKILTLWKENCEMAERAKTSISPQQFAELFVDDNLV